VAGFTDGNTWHVGCFTIPPMRRILPLTLLALTLFGGVATADRDRHRDRGRRDDHRRGGVVVREQRDYRPVRRDRRAVQRRPIYVNNGRYVFHGGVTRTYTRPVIRQRYYDVRVRPVVIVENYDPAPGYIWVQGHWQWNGYEWTWTSGYYAPDTRYRVWYDDDTYE
jgi:hypothetical protein